MEPPCRILNWFRSSENLNTIWSVDATPPHAEKWRLTTSLPDSTYAFEGSDDDVNPNHFYAPHTVSQVGRARRRVAAPLLLFVLLTRLSSGRRSLFVWYICWVGRCFFSSSSFRVCPVGGGRSHSVQAACKL
jgi:hypothetical protein